MKNSCHWAVAILLLTSSLEVCGDDGRSSSQPDFLIGGCGGAYLLAEHGELVIDVYKRDRNRGRKTELRAILIGPDRQVLDEVRIPDDDQPRGSGMGPPQTARLTTMVKHKGIFGLNITVSQDRYGEQMVWGFRTNCAKFMIETSRGHRDRRHEEPIVLQNPGSPAKVCFAPRSSKFAIELSGLPTSVNEATMSDAQGNLITTMTVDNDGSVKHDFPADPSRGNEPWRLEFASQQATIHIDGLTRWDKNDRIQDVSFWTPNPTSYFPFLQHRWLLTPYQQTTFAEPATRGYFRFRLRNDSSSKQTVRLSLETDDGVLPENWLLRDGDALADPSETTLPPGGTKLIRLSYTAPAVGKQRRCRLRATLANDPSFSTYSTLVVEGGKAPASEPLDIPLQLEPYRHENEQFGYLPHYPTQNQFYFDPQGNRPYMCLPDRIVSGPWTPLSADMANESNTRPRDSAQPSIRYITSKIAFDRDHNLYALGRVDGHAALVHRPLSESSYSVTAISGGGGRPSTLDIEQFSGHNTPDSPPPIVRYTRTASDPNLIWRRINDLELFLPEKKAGKIVMGDPILLSRKCIGLSSHSGIPSSVVSRGDKVHVAWGEATDPKEKVPGVPTYVVTYDRSNRRLGKPALVAYGPPANDVHNSPSITIDSRGYLHVLAGTHGQPFPYCRSLQPNDAGSGWTEPELVGNGRQTYVGFVCGKDDTLHVVFRLWQTNQEPHPLSHHATLAYQRKRPGQPWEEPKILVVAPFSEYSIFYHRLTIDNRGRLFLAYDYWSTYWFYRNDHYGDRRALMMSPDHGDTWKLVETSDLQ